jgi:8-oxo-dGTP pyrophosphatase MutT (NUDIX family)
MLDDYLNIFNHQPKKRRRHKKTKRQFIIGKNAYVSAGVIFCRYINGSPHYLLIKRTGDVRFRFEDLGGKIDDEDEDLIDLAAREAAEECNAALVPRDLNEITKVRTLYDKALNDSISYIKQLVTYYKVKPLLFPEIKYAVYVIPLPDDMEMQDFGEVEIVHDVENNSPIKRTLNWYSDYQLKKINIREFNPRIRVLVNGLFKRHYY